MVEKKKEKKEKQLVEPALSQHAGQWRLGQMVYATISP